MNGFTLKEVLVMLVVLAALAITLVLCSCDNKGIIALEGYEHGVAFCGSEFKSVAHAASAYAWEEGRATYVVNKGHLHDPQVAELKALAEARCAKREEAENAGHTVPSGHRLGGSAPIGIR